MVINCGGGRGVGKEREMFINIKWEYLMKMKTSVCSVLLAICLNVKILKT
jgi:hypothetical protein